MKYASLKAHPLPLRCLMLFMTLCVGAFLIVLFALHAGAEDEDISAAQSFNAVPAAYEDTASAAALDIETSRISAGYDHSLFVADDGSLWASGGGACGQLGNGSLEVSPEPVLIFDSDVSFALAGKAKSLAIKSDGGLWFWGGREGDPDAAVPRKLFDGAVSAAMSGYGLLILTDSGNLIFCDPDAAEAESGLIPVDLPGTTASIAADEDHFLAVMQDGGLWELTADAVPRKILDDVCFSAAGGGVSYAIQTDGSLWAFEDRSLALQDDGEERGPDEPVWIMDGAVSVFAAHNYILILTQGGELWFWGGADKTAPLKVMTDVLSASAGWKHCLAAALDGSVWAFGLNESGRFGCASPASSAVPYKVFLNMSADGPTPSPKYIVTVHPDAKVLVAGLKAGVPVKIRAETGAAVEDSLFVAIYEGEKRITPPVKVTDGTATLFFNLLEETGPLIRAGLSRNGMAPEWFDDIEVRHIENLWEPVVVANSAYTHVAFDVEEVALHPQKAEASINGEGVKMVICSDRKSLILWRPLQGKDSLIILKGIRYPLLFPKYSLTFTLTA